MRGSVGGSGGIVTYSKKAPVVQKKSSGAQGSPPVKPLMNGEGGKEASGSESQREKWFFVESGDPFALTDEDEDSLMDSDSKGSTGNAKEDGKRTMKKDGKRPSTIQVNVSCGLPPDVDLTSSAKKRPARERWLEEVRETRARKRQAIAETKKEEDKKVIDAEEDDNPLLIQGEETKDGLLSTKTTTTTKEAQVSDGVKAKKTQNKKKETGKQSFDLNDNEGTMTLLQEDSVSLLECAELKDRTELLDDLQYTFDGIKHGGSVRLKSAVHLLDRCFSDARGVGLLFRSEDLFRQLFDVLTPGTRPEDVKETCVELALLGSLLLMLCEDEVNCTQITVPALKAFATDISTLSDPSGGERKSKVSTALSGECRSSSDGVLLTGSSAVKSRARSAFFSCLKSPQKASDHPTPVSAVSPGNASASMPSLSAQQQGDEVEDSELLNKVKRIICTSDRFAGSNKDIVCIARFP